MLMQSSSLSVCLPGLLGSPSCASQGVPQDGGLAPHPYSRQDRIKKVSLRFLSLLMCLSGNDDGVQQYMVGSSHLISQYFTVTLGTI